MRKFTIPSKLKDQQGQIVIIVGLVMFMLMGFAALAIDLSHLYVVKNELQNAADAGALAGARELYLNDGTTVNPGANQTAYATATANRSEVAAVEVNWTSGNTGDIQRGHWAFATRTFTPNDSLAPPVLWGVSEDELDADINLINAVRCVTRREFSPPVASFFARIFGFQLFQFSASAIAYRGFAGTIQSGEVDQPIAICEDSLTTTVGNEYTGCSIARRSPTSSKSMQETAAWTDFNQDSPCVGGTNEQKVSPLVCRNGNPQNINLGAPIAVINGEVTTSYKELKDCWEAETLKEKPWTMTLPVIKCGPGGKVDTCAATTGVVRVHVLWMTPQGLDQLVGDAPRKMAAITDAEGIEMVAAWPTAQEMALAPPDWDTNDQVRWDSFQNHYNLQNGDGSPAPYDKKSIYFLPNCSTVKVTGNSGGTNYGILAKIPVLVK